MRHGLACLASAWALMAVMVVAGLGDLWWMAALTVVMVYEAVGRHGLRMAGLAGALLLWLAALILLARLAARLTATPRDGQPSVASAPRCSVRRRFSR